MALQDPQSLSPEALRRYIASRHEARFLLIDVRQETEYRDAHIPGAQLIPSGRTWSYDRGQMPGCF